MPTILQNHYVLAVHDVRMAASELGCHSYFAYLRVDDVDEYHAQFLRAGFQSMDAPAERPWGMREFGVKTPDEHRIMIGLKMMGNP